MRPPGTFLYLLFLTLCPAVVFAQAKQENKQVHNLFDKTVGLENTGLYNGVEYIEQHITINDRHKFFRSPDFLRGSVVYEGQPYFEVDLKYNVFDDLLLVRLQKRGGESAFQLHQENIKEFTIGDQRFMRLTPEETENSDITGFYEVLYESESFHVLKKHRKKSRKLLEKEFTYFEFQPTSPQHVFYYNGNYQQGTSRRKVAEIFPDHRKEIRAYYRANKTLRKSNPDLFMINLFKELNGLVPTTNPSQE